MNDELDDRLLALALGLDDDPELRARIERSPELAERLRRLRAELATVEERLGTVVPGEPEGWSDLSSERWEGLRPFVNVEEASRQTTTSPARHDERLPGTARSAGDRERDRGAWWRPLRRRWQTLAPAAIAVLVAAVVLGVVTGRDSPLRTVGSESGDGGSAYMDKDLSTAEGGAAPAADAAPGFLITDVEDYATVVIAVAEPLDGAEQPYRVDRVLKGQASATVRLETEVDGDLAPGTLAVLFLDPYHDLAGARRPLVTLDGDQRDGTATGDAESLSGQALEAEPRMYLQDGETVVVVSLPAGTEPEAVRLE